jgi:hypothetical protein
LRGSVHAGLEANEKINAKNFSTVIPAQAGIHAELALVTALWIPAFAGMTIGEVMGRIN